METRKLLLALCFQAVFLAICSTAGPIDISRADGYDVEVGRPRKKGPRPEQKHLDSTIKMSGDALTVPLNAYMDEQLQIYVEELEAKMLHPVRRGAAGRGLLVIALRDLLKVNLGQRR